MAPRGGSIKCAGLKMTLGTEAGRVGQEGPGAAEDRRLESQLAELLLRELKPGSDKLAREFRELTGTETYRVTQSQPGGCGTLKLKVTTRQQSAF